MEDQAGGTMNQIVERVARAIQAADFKGSNITFDEMNPIRQHNYLSSARAAVEAMREPTPEMAIAAFKYCTNIGAWKAMIDEALR